MKLFFSATRDAARDPFFPMPYWKAGFWVLWHWKSIKELYKETEK